MLRLCRYLRVGLPFEPMALTTLDALEARLTSLSDETTGSIIRESSVLGSNDTCKWFDMKSVPFFISPKHDGVRLISYGADSTSANNHNNTCFSRYGRPIYGMFWIEQELAMLRALCGDDALVLDGELYIHRTVSDKDKLRSNANSQAKRKLKKEEGQDAKDHEGGDEFKTGFLAVSALVHRLRGSSGQFATVDDVLQYVSSLPQFCLFDVPSFNPKRLREKRAARTSCKVQEEEDRIRQQSLHALQAQDAVELRCVPNVTPFSQRLRTLHYLGNLLDRGTQSPILREAYLSRPTQEQQQKRLSSSSSSSYLGGQYVRLIPYSLARSLSEAKDTLLPSYVSNGYEGAVIRTPTNVYEMREKRRGTVQQLVTTPAAPSTVDTQAKKGRLHSSPPQPRLIDEEESALEQVAVQRVKQLPRRSLTAVKLLPFHDKEYPVLRPLLKEPSTNPRTRQLVSIPLARVEASSGAGAPLVAKPGAPKGGSDTVVFYGLQCLSENGRVFNVSIPKMSADKQRAVLEHLLKAGKRGGKGKKNSSSITGMFVTVKYSTLTEHGVPRFGTVKAIRGGKGWFL